MTDLSTIKEPQIVKSVDGKTAVKYQVVSETIDLEALKKEKGELEAQLAEKVPTDKELLAFAKFSHPYYIVQRKQLEDRIVQINSILN